MVEIQSGTPEALRPQGKIINFETARQRIAETRQDKDAARPVIRPIARTGREKWQESKRLQSIRDALTRESEESTTAPLAIGAVQERINKGWLLDFLRTRFHSPEQPITDKDWATLKRLNPRMHDEVREDVRLENRVREIREQAQGDQRVFDALWGQELKAIHAEFDKKKVEEWAKVGIKRLPDEEWVKQIQKTTDEEWIESFKESMRRGHIILEPSDKKMRKLMNRAHRELQWEGIFHRGKPAPQAVLGFSEQGHFDHIEWYRTLPTIQKIQFLNYAMGEFTHDKQIENTLWQDISELISLFVDLFRLIINPFKKQHNHDIASKQELG